MPRASSSTATSLMASSPARRHLLPLLLLVLFLATERRHAEARALPPTVAARRARQAFHHLAPAPAAAGTGRAGGQDAGMARNEAGARRPIREWRRRNTRRGDGGGGTGASTFSAMLPRGFVPPSGSSACHNDMPATAADAQLFACSGGSGSP